MMKAARIEIIICSLKGGMINFLIHMWLYVLWTLLERSFVAHCGRCVIFVAIKDSLFIAL